MATSKDQRWPKCSADIEPESFGPPRVGVGDPPTIPDGPAFKRPARCTSPDCNWQGPKNQAGPLKLTHYRTEPSVAEDA